MGDLLRSGLAWLADQLHAHAARPIMYRRGTQQIALNATLGRKEFEADTHEGRLYFRSNDFLVRAADLTFGGQPVLPERGDQIDMSFDGSLATFEVLAHDGIPPWEFSDPHQQMLRIHTKKVA
jgi:hypothetical protein